MLRYDPLARMATIEMEMRLQHAVQVRLRRAAAREQWQTPAEIAWRPSRLVMGRTYAVRVWKRLRHRSMQRLHPAPLAEPES